MTVDLSRFDEIYTKTETAPDTGGYQELPPGEYTMMVVGVGWLDVRPDDPSGFAGMGPCWRLRVCGGEHHGRTEQYRQFLIRKHPERGIENVEANGQAKTFFERDCKRAGLCAPSTLSEIADWNDPLWKTLRVEIKLREGKNGRTYRNVWINGTGANPGGVTFVREVLIGNRWSADPTVAGAPQVPYLDEEIPF